MKTSSGSRMAAAFVAALTLASACSGGGDGADEPPSITTTTTIIIPTTVPAPVTTTVEAYSGPVGALTGAPIPEDRVGAPALVMKIGNNDSKSRPQTGLFEADLVYEELVEGLKTRFFTVFNTQVPDTIGPIRSGRSSDIHLMAGLSKPMFGYSGANTTVLSELRKARDAGVMVDVGALRLESAYFRSEDRDAPDNLYATPGEIPETSAGVPGPLFTYGRLSGSMGTEVGGVDVAYPTKFGRESTHLWDSDAAGWVRIQDGTLQTSVVNGAEVEVAPANVVVVEINYGTSAADAESPQAKTFGGGPVKVFTQGRMVEGTWSRSADSPRWTLTDSSGVEIPLAPGATWVLLAAGPHSQFATAKVSVMDAEQAQKLLTEARKTATP